VGSEAANSGVVGDVAKLLMHPLIVRMLRRESFERRRYETIML
jgi:hypothetical protein